MKVISFEGSIGAGKTSLTNFFSHEFKSNKLCEDFEANPFLKKFYEKQNVNFETEITFLLIHYYQIRNAIENRSSDLLFMDFSIEKDLAYARMNLKSTKLSLFENIFYHVIEEVGLCDLVIYIEISPKILRRRIFQRGRPYELSADFSYFEKYHNANNSKTTGNPLLA
jgi:deoxyguanosine kinase